MQQGSTVEDKIVVVLRLIPFFALPSSLDIDTVAALIDWIYSAGIRHSAINDSPDGPGKMARFLVDYAGRTPAERRDLHEDMLPLWFRNNGGVENFPV